MRADAHYVDQLEMRRVTPDDARPLSASAPVTAAPPAQSRSEQSLLNESELANSLTSVLSCTDLLGDGMPPLTRTVAIDMIRAETQRTICALRTSALLKHGVPDDRRLVSPRTVLERVVDTVRADTRLRGTRLATVVSAPDDATMRINDDAIVTGLSAVVLMMSAGLNDVHGAQLDVEVAAASSGRVSLTIRQESVILPEAYLKAANTRADLATNATFAPLLALRQIAESHGGSLAITRLPHGTQVCVELAANI
jgi:signal transduction histidine kinase